MIRDLPEKLRALRTQQELSQKDVAYRLGISPSGVSAYELGERTPSTEVILAIAAPVFVMAFDYIDALDCGCTPPQDSMYWVAPFVEKFMKENISLIDSNCYQYLKDCSIMQFSD